MLKVSHRYDSESNLSSLSAIATSLLLAYIGVCILSLHSTHVLTYCVSFYHSSGSYGDIEKKLHCGNGLLRLTWIPKRLSRMPVIQAFLSAS